MKKEGRKGKNEIIRKKKDKKKYRRKYIRSRSRMRCRKYEVISNRLVGGGNSR